MRLNLEALRRHKCLPTSSHYVRNREDVRHSLSIRESLISCAAAQRPRVTLAKSRVQHSRKSRAQRSQSTVNKSPSETVNCESAKVKVEVHVEVGGL